MSNDMMYWLIIGSAFALTSLLALILMLRTNRLAPAFWISLAANFIIIVYGTLWWNGLYTGVQRMFGIFGFWVAFANIEILVFFVLFSIRKKQDK